MQDLAATEREDRTLITAVAAGDRVAFAALCRRHGPGVLRLARAVAGEAAGEDVLQEVFLAVFRHAHTFRGESTPRAWLYALARHAAFRAKRAAARAPVPDSPHVYEGAAGADGLLDLGLAAGFGAIDDPEALVAAAEDQATLAAALASLPEEERAVIVLRDLEGLSGEEAAAALELGLPAMKSRLHRGRLRLMAALRRARRKEEAHGGA